MFTDDAGSIIDWGEQGYKREQMRQPAINFFTKFYNDNKIEIKKGIEKYLDEYYDD